jgi:hypothetical protein
VRWSGLLSSLPLDYLAKSYGMSHTSEAVTAALPFPIRDGELDDALVEVTLRMNCITSHHADLWNEIMPTISRDAGPWAPPKWHRTDLDRWRALTEVDSLAALILGITEDQLIQMYRSQFGVLRMYEHATVFDASGRQIAREHHAWTPRQRTFEDELKAAPTRRGETKLKLWQRVEAYRDGDKAIDLDFAVPPFRRADRELAMRNAYRKHAEAVGQTDGVSDAPLWEWEVWGE